MIILIDIGNTRTKYVELVGEQISTVSTLNNVEFNVHYFTQHYKNAQKILVASVANTQLVSKLESWCEQQNIKLTQVHSESHKNNVISAYQEPSKLGIDRWLALLAANHLYPNQNVLIIDAGTATTVDYLAEDGYHQGGWILAGIKALVDGILSHSTLVHAEEEAKPQLNFAVNTSDNVHHASWSATVGLIHQAIKEAEQQASLAVILLTGGNGQTLTTLLLSELTQDDDLKNKIHFIDDLIFYGLLQYSK